MLFLLVTDREGCSAMEEYINLTLGIYVIEHSNVGMKYWGLSLQGARRVAAQCSGNIDLGAQVGKEPGGLLPSALGASN